MFMGKVSVLSQANIRGTFPEEIQGHMQKTKKQKNSGESELIGNLSNDDGNDNENVT